MGIWIGGRGPIIKNPFLGIPTFGQALEQDRAQWEESQRAQFGDQYSFFQEGPTGGFVVDWSVISRSPGGGGPGQFLTSTATPPSVEEVGRIITGLSNMGHGEPGVGRGKKNGKSRFPKWCPAKKWGRPCLLREGHKGPHHFQYHKD